ncbi:MAG: peptide IlvX [Metakosakonia sp.]|nr:peptide IlvX [Phytobacter sp.]
MSSSTKFCFSRFAAGN